MTLFKLKKLSIATAVLCVFLASCGGGGDDDEPQQMTPVAPAPGPAPAPPPTPPSSATQFQIADADMIASVATQLSVTRDLSLLVFQDFGSDGFAKRTAGQATKLKRISQKTETITENCSTSGSIAVTADDRNNNDRLDVGDVVTLAANSCLNGTELLTGQISVTVDSLTGNLESDVFALGFRANVANVNVSDTAIGRRETLNGVLTAEIRSTSATAQSYAVRTSSVASTSRLNSASPTRSSILTAVAITGNLSAGNFSEQVVARLVDSRLVNGRPIDIATPVPLFTTGADLYPRSGTITLSVPSAPRSNARLVALNNTQVRLDVDPDGDNVYVPADSRTLQWAQIL